MILNSNLKTRQYSGTGYCKGHFGEILQGVFRTVDGKPCRGLVTISNQNIGSMISVILTPGYGEITASNGMNKVISAVRAYDEHHNLPTLYDTTIVTMSSIQRGIGMGSSTADIVSLIRALDQAHGLYSTVEDVVKITLSVEIACDPTMIGGQPILFAQRDGCVLERFTGPLPEIEIEAFDLEPGVTFQTDEIPPAEYNDAHIEEFEELRNILRRAIKHGCPNLLARVATASAQINESFFPKKNFSEVQALALETNALGICVSHSGTVAGIIYSPSKTLDLKTRNLIREFTSSNGVQRLGLVKV